MTIRKGLCKGSGKQGYYNIVQQDPFVHSLSARGIKSYLPLKGITLKGYARSSIQSFKINDEYSIVCYSEGTRTGFRHMCSLLRNGYEVEKAKAVYYNRTWEAYEYQTVIHDVLKKHFPEQEAKQLIDNFEKSKKTLHVKKNCSVNLNAKLTLDDAKKLKYGDIIITPAYENADGTPQRWRVTGKVKTWKTDPTRIKVPIKRGLYEFYYITEENIDLFEKPNSLYAKGKDYIKGGLADNVPLNKFPKSQMKMGQKVEMEHTDNPAIAREIARDHLTEHKNYYTKLKKAEKKMKKGVLE